MKATHLSISFSFSLSLLSIYTICAAQASGPPPVLDVAGKQLRAGAGYYILPVIRGTGGGLTSSNRTCPFDVVQDQLEACNAGRPVTFHPVDSKKGAVRVSIDHNIKFSGASACAQSAVWMLNHDPSIDKFVISTGGVEGDPRRETMHSWFQIEEYEGDYKLVFCPTVCFRCNVICRDIAVLVEDGGTRLTLMDDTDTPFRVMFKKA